MNPPVPAPDEVDTAARVASTLELWAKIAGSLLLVGGFLKGVVKPFIEWRREHQAKVIREILEPELKMLNRVISQEDGCADRMERVLKRQEALFADHDLLVDISIDNRERNDETNMLLDAMGFASDRRTSVERREEIRLMIEELERRRRERRRQITDEHSTERRDE